MDKKLNNFGFSLLEVLIATSIFAIFASVYVVSQGFNLSRSTQMVEEIKLRELCENKINEIILDPPDLVESLTMSKEEKDFEKDKDYKYIIIWKRFELPDFNKIKGEEDEDEQADQASSAFEKKIYTQIQKNIKELLWQVEVTVKNKKTDYPFTLSTWIYNNEAEVKFSKF